MKKIQFVCGVFVKKTTGGFLFSQTSEEVMEEGQQRRRQTDADTLRQTMAATRAALDAAQTELMVVKTQADAAQVAASAEKAAAANRLAQYIDLDGIHAAQRIMSANADKVGVQARRAFDEARRLIQRERDKLHAAGLRSRGLSGLASANFNRPDRDHPRFITEDLLLQITPISREDDD